MNWGLHYPTLLAFLSQTDPEGEKGYRIQPADVGRPLWTRTSECPFQISVEECNLNQWVYLTKDPHGFEFRPTPRPPTQRKRCKKI